MSQAFRLELGGEIERGRVLRFRFNGREYEGHPGDTLASALLANGVRLVARSFKYHRPRGILTAGVEEPNALVQLGTGGRTVPNLKATEIELFDGLEARSVNVFPSLRFDLGSLAGALSRLMPAGFYYKTFFVSLRLWHGVFEPLIRRSGGWGRAPREPDPDFYDRMHAHCDVLVVGGGPAGIAAARAAAAGGARVILADENDAFGGSLRHREVTLDDAAGIDWVRRGIAQLRSMDEVQLLRRITVFGYYDGNYLAALQRFGPEGEGSRAGRVRQRVWHIRARRVILATGAQERPLVFTNNDRPGIMLASAVQAYVNRWAVMPGRAMVLFTNNDRAYECALDVAKAGRRVAAVVDSRSEPGGELIGAVRDNGIEVLPGHAVFDSHGRSTLRSVDVAPLVDGTPARESLRRIDCDLLAVSGGYNPVVHLHSQAGGRLRYDESNGCFRPDTLQQAAISVGAANACFSLARALEGATESGLRAAEEVGYPVSTSPEQSRVEEFQAAPPQALWRIPHPRRAASAESRQFIDLHNDSRVADIRLAVREGFESVEHMKRYTLSGFGTDQGKTSNINALGILSQLVSKPIPEVGTTTFRPPYTPVTFAAMGGRDRGELFDPARLTAMHEQHAELGARFEDVGQWKRPWYYPLEGEDMRAAVARECAAVREGVGLIDASTLGKIDIQGPDAAEFLNRVYTNLWTTLQTGRVRYGVMCREDGMVFDDGTTSRIDQQRYLMTTTTGNAAAVLDHLEEYLQTEWPELRVRLTSVTEQWSTLGVAGPKSRAVLAKLAPAMDLSSEGFSFMSWRDARVAGLDARVFRISFTGELQYEINVPWHHGPALWAAVIEAGSEYDITPYGTESMHVLRAEKGFIIVGQETDGTQTPIDLGLGWLVSEQKDFIGRRSLSRSDTRREDRPQLVGLMPQDASKFVPEGSQLVEQGGAGRKPPVPMLGFVTSSYWSPALESHFCLALVRAGSRRHGEVIEAALADGAVPMQIRSPVFIDPDNERRDG